jgi:DNA repair photolyase
MFYAAEVRWRQVGEDGQGSLFADDEVVERHVGVGAYEGLEFLHVNARTVINEVPASSRMPFRYTINAYRGCSHACLFCFARPTHDYLGLGIGEDFDRKIVVKVNAVERVRAELRSRRWRGEPIAMGTNTDPYQKAEGKYHLTRGIIAALAEAANPFSILTKSTLVLRDRDVLVDATRRTDVRVNLSIGTLDRDVWRLMEPGTPPPAKRVEAVAKLNAAGIPCGVLVAPVLPGLSDAEDQLVSVAEACVDAGAVSVSAVSLHLRPGVRDYFLDRLRQDRPDLIDSYERRYRGRAYLAPAEQERVSAIVGDAVRRAQGRAVSRPRARARALPAEPPARVNAPTAQLSFDL